MGLKNYIGAFIMTALFAFALISFAANFANDNNSAINIGHDSEYADLTTNTKGDVDTLYIQANISATAVQEGTISTQTEATQGGTEFKVGIWNSFDMAKRSADIAFKKIFGGDSAFSIFFTALAAFISFAIGWFIIKAWKGNPD